MLHHKPDGWVRKGSKSACTNHRISLEMFIAKKKNGELGS